MVYRPVDPKNESGAVTNTMQEKCAAALNEFVAMFMDLGMSTFEIADVIEAELPKLRRPFQNPADNEPQA